MAADWTSVNDILKDLSVAQGRNVPASLEIYGNTPPSLNSDEDSEYCLKSDGDINFATKPPDFGFIQEMLSMVSDKKKILQDCSNSNLNPTAPEFIPGRKRKMEVLSKNKICRNVALKSILDRLEAKRLESMPDVSKSPNSMFRKKRISELDESSAISRTKSDKSYTPTVLANEYYKKYVENTKLRDQNKRDILEPVREIYVRRDPALHKKYLCLEKDCSMNSNENSTESGRTFLLGRHRHLSLDKIEECIVCSVLEKHGYKMKKEEIEEIGPWGDGLNLKYVTTPNYPEDNGNKDRGCDPKPQLFI